MIENVTKSADERVLIIGTDLTTLKRCADKVTLPQTKKVILDIEGGDYC